MIDVTRANSWAEISDGQAVGATIDTQAHAEDSESILHHTLHAYFPEHSWQLC